MVSTQSILLYFVNVWGLVRKFILKRPDNMKMDITDAFIMVGCGWNWWGSCPMKGFLLVVLKFHSLLWH